MRLVVQRVARAAVRVRGETIAEIGRGLLVLAGVGAAEAYVPDDGAIEWLARKVAGLRIFDDEHGTMNRSVGDVGGAVVVVPQFTLYGDVTRGRRPSWAAAAAPDAARERIETFVSMLRAAGATVRHGAFGAHMEVELVNDGPVTIVMERAPGS